ncbi:cysteine hydrolase family protein [Pseudomonas asuensis]|uniref:Cysteine hydrolase n=1 Tax=Pseudomonas asuensis TaxID=1825787 RepID=A0ABQ2GGR9_9PSED|nr:cysteine hydrolase family protein [Pseudomonas asuensis]GGL94468.1 cysteine hydrolase [Pseudomonas asuensis]
MNNRSAALLIIDQQQGIHSPALGPRNHPEAEQRIAALLAIWRKQGWPIVHVRHISRNPQSVFAPGQPGAEFQPLLSPLPQEMVFEKNVTDAFIHSGLERWLHARAINQVVITGVASENSVEATARTASNLGFATCVVEDACYTFAKTDFYGTPRSAKEVHAMAMSNLQQEYAEVMTTAQLLSGLGFTLS